MPDSDDFDFDDNDDSAFLAAATQIEASQHVSHAHFEASPRPAKRRKVLGELTQASNDTIEDHYDVDDALLEDEINARAHEADHGAEEEYFEDQEQGSKKSKYKIHVPVDAGRFDDKFLSQTQRDLDEDLGAFRGAIWKKPPPKQAPKPPPRAPSHLLNRAQKKPPGLSRSGNGSPLFSKASGQQRISSLFKRQVSVEDDAAMAARLQAEEDDLGLRPNNGNTQNVDVPQHTSNTADDRIECLLPDDFPSSLPEGLLDDDITITAVNQRQAPMPPPARPPGVRAPMTGLKQMTIFGGAATQELTASQAAQKKHAWPLKNREQPPTHHKLDDEALKTWVYPTNLGSIRDYQFSIVKRSLFHNTLVALPTGLGKTFIAATVMLNFYHWTKDAQIIFMAPTKPLIAQQMDACYHIVGIPQSDTVLMTGETSPAVRGEQWQDKRVFFMTPQTVINDLKHGICDPKRLVLIVVDEAHKATGGYAYTEVIAFTRRFNKSFRVLALTATPGGKLESVQAVIDNLDISRVELRTEESIDIVKYTHRKDTDTEQFEPNEEQELIMGYVANAVRPTLEKINSQNAYWCKDPMKLTAFGLTQARQRWVRSEPGTKAPQAVKWMINMAFTTLSSIAHGIGLLQYHGISPFFSSAVAFEKGVAGGEHKGKSAKSIIEHPDWLKMMNTLRTWTGRPNFVGHPKLEYLQHVVADHFLNTGEGMQGPDVPPSATRVMIFASFRDSTEDICRVLKRHEPLIRPHIFVGQSGNAKSGAEGMSQKKQNEVVKDFKSGKYNVLVATSIGEEGLDIGDVDLIVCYDASSSPIRMLQRVGRTGRKRVGRVVLLLMKGKEESDYAKAKDNYSWIQKSIADPKKYNYREEQSMRIVPKDIEPVVDMRVIEIPQENSQPVDTSEKGRRATKGKAKRAPKKFHMPDNVRTGFVQASRLGSDDDDDGEESASKKKAHARKPTAATSKQAPLPRPPEIVPVPALKDVLLNPMQERELARKYAAAGSESSQVVQAPDITRDLDRWRDLGSISSVRHGAAAASISEALQAIRNINDDKVERMKSLLNHDMLDSYGPSKNRLVDVQQAITFSDDDDDMPSPPRPKGKPGPKPRPASKPKVASQAKAAPKPRPAPKPQVQKLPAAATKPRKTACPIREHDDDLAAEGASSSPPPTAEDMRIATQGIDIGSSDTSGEDEEEGEPDSDMEDFIAKSDEMIETVSSSLTRLTPQKQKRGKGRGLKRGLKAVVEVSEEENSDADDDAGEMFSTPPESAAAATVRLSSPVRAPAALAGRKRRVVDDDSDDG